MTGSLRMVIYYGFNMVICHGLMADYDWIPPQKMHHRRLGWLWRPTVAADRADAGGFSEP